MTRTEYRAAVGAAYIIMVIVFIVLGLIIGLHPYIQDMGSVNILFIIIGAVFIISALFLIVFSRTVRYIFDDEGLSIKGIIGTTMLNEEYLNEVVPYRSITEFRETRDIGYAAGFTSDALRIYYIKKNGRKDSFVIGPVEKKEFIAELENRTGLKKKE